MKTKYVVFIALLLLGCSYLNQKHKGMSDKVVKEKEEKLFDATIQLLEVSSKDPVTYRNARRTFEIALARYLQATGWRNDRIVYVEKQGVTLLLPVQIIQSGDLSVEAVPMLRDSVRVLWMPTGPLFKGKIVDLKWFSAKNSKPAFILALFPDSLKSLSRKDNTLSPNFTVIFDSTMRRPLRALFPAGLFFLPTMADEGLQIPFTTTSLNHVQVLSVPNGMQSEFGPSPEILSSTDLDLTWSYKEGQDILWDSGKDKTGIRSIRKLPGTNMQVLLDQNGFLILSEDSEQSPVWISEQPWGNRVFLIDSTNIAVCDSRHSTVAVFEYSNRNELQLLGQSSPFDGNVTAITSTGEGILINTVTYDSTNTPWSQLHLVPEKNQLWNMPPKPIEPEYPNYNSKLVFLPGESLYLSGSDWLESMPQVVWRNVYETLFRNGKNNVLLPNLVSSTEHDSSRTRWRFQLKPDIRFADGTPLTAEDVIVSWQTNIKESAKTKPNTRWLWKDIWGVADFIQGPPESIEGFHEIDKLSLEVHLTKSIPNFPHHLASPVFGIKKPGTRWSIGTGPFKIVEIQKEKSLFSISCKRNRYYHGGMPPLQRLIFAFEIGSPSDFLTNNRDAAASIRRMKDIEYFRDIPNFRVIPVPDEIIYFLALNPLSGSLSDVEFRRKIVSSLSREIVAKMITEAESYPANHLVARKAGENFEAIISRDNYSRSSHPLTVAYCKEDPVSRQIAERLATKLSEMEIPHRAPVEFSAKYFSQSRQNGNYDILVDYYVPSYGNDAYNLLQICYGGYVLEKEISDQLYNLLPDPNKAHAMRIEQEVIERAILYPVVMTKNYVVFPSALRDLKIFGAEEIEFYRAWKPL